MLLVVAVAPYLAVFASDVFPVEHRFRRWRAELALEEAPKYSD